MSRCMMARPLFVAIRVQKASINSSSGCVSGPKILRMFLARLARFINWATRGP